VGLLELADRVIRLKRLHKGLVGQILCPERMCVEFEVDQSDLIIGNETPIVAFTIHQIAA
jgi:hypothetical protein